MNESRAQSAVTTSALIVAAIYAYRKFIEDEPVAAGAADPKDLLGFGALPPLGTFAIGWGFSFLVLAVLAEWDPTLGGYLALLILIGSLLANGEQISKHVLEKLGGEPTKAKTTAEDSSLPTVSVAYFSGGTVTPATIAASAPKSMNLSKPPKKTSAIHPSQVV